MPRFLIAITSCKKDALTGYNQAQRDTFLKDFQHFPDAMYRFFIGDGTPSGEEETLVRLSVDGCIDMNRGVDYKEKCAQSEQAASTYHYPNVKYDEVLLPVPDDYFHLVYKVRAIHRWALQFNFTHIYKCDTDTYVDIGRLLQSGFHEHEFTGGPSGDTSVAGGSGYWVSRTSAEILAHAPITYWAEDGWTSGTLRQHGIMLRPDFRYSDNPLREDNDIIATHLGFRAGYTVKMMYELYHHINTRIRGVRNPAVSHDPIQEYDVF